MFLIFFQGSFDGVDGISAGLIYKPLIIDIFITFQYNHGKKYHKNLNMKTSVLSYKISRIQEFPGASASGRSPDILPKSDAPSHFKSWIRPWKEEKVSKRETTHAGFMEKFFFKNKNTQYMYKMHQACSIRWLGVGGGGNKLLSLNLHKGNRT